MPSLHDCGMGNWILQIAVNLAWAGLARVKVYRQNIASQRNFLYSAQWLHCHRPVSLLSIQSKTWLSFLSSLAEWAQKFKFLKLAVLWSDSMKRNSRRFTFTNFVCAVIKCFPTMRKRELARLLSSRFDLSDLTSYEKSEIFNSKKICL